MTDAEARAVLDEIHAALCHPWEWSADTPERVGHILTFAGYTFPDEPAVREMDERYDGEVPDDEFEPWRPAREVG